MLWKRVDVSTGKKDRVQVWEREKWDPELMRHYGLAERWISQNRKQGLSFAFTIRKRRERQR